MHYSFYRNADKDIIEKHSSDFNGNLSDMEIVQMNGVAKNTYYRYKRELKEQHRLD